MKEFELTEKMLTMSGVFYPTGHAFIMFPDNEKATQVAEELESMTDNIMMLTPAVILRQIGKIDGDSEVDLPQVGTEGATLKKFIDLARKGHHALMIAVPSSEVAEKIMVAVRKTPYSYAQRYHMLAMEDLE